MEAEMLQRLLELLSAEFCSSAGDPFIALVREARTEALAEAKALLKGMFVQAILQAALEGHPTASAEAALTDPVAMPPKGSGMSEVLISGQQEESVSSPIASRPPIPKAADDKQELLSEMEAIRRQLAENEERLRRAKTPASGVDKALPEMVTDRVEPVADVVETYAYYVYGIVSAATAPNDDAWPKAGIDVACPVLGMPYREIQAAVSRVPISEFGEQALAAHLENLMWIEDKVRRHQEVLEALMQHGPLIPLRFCTLYSDPGRVQEMLAEHYEDWVQLLSTLQGKQEWGVKAYLDHHALTHKVGEISPRIRQLNTEIAQRSSGAAYFAKKKLEEAVAEEVERLGDEYAQDSHDRLTRCAVDARLNPLQRQETAARDEKMLLNGAYLVREAQYPIFQAQIAALKEQYGPLGLTYTLTGPWPPYNFVRDPEEGVAVDEPGRS